MLFGHCQRRFIQLRIYTCGPSQPEAGIYSWMLMMKSLSMSQPSSTLIYILPYSKRAPTNYLYHGSIKSGPSCRVTRQCAASVVRRFYKGRTKLRKWLANAIVSSRSHEPRSNSRKRCKRTPKTLNPKPTTSSCIFSSSFGNGCINLRAANG